MEKIFNNSMDIVISEVDRDILESSINTPMYSLDGINTLAKCVKVYDGDTVHLVFRPHSGLPVRRYKCRLIGYDSPEIKTGSAENKMKGKLAKDTLTDLIYNKIVTVHIGKYDKYGRLLVSIYLNGENINEYMIYNGGKK